MRTLIFWGRRFGKTTRDKAPAEDTAHLFKLINQAKKEGYRVRPGWRETGSHFIYKPDGTQFNEIGHPTESSAWLFVAYYLDYLENNQE